MLTRTRRAPAVAGRSRDDDVGVQVLAGGWRDPGGVDVVDGVGHLHAPGADGREEVTVGVQGNR